MKIRHTCATGPDKHARQYDFDIIVYTHSNNTEGRHSIRIESIQRFMLLNIRLNNISFEFFSESSLSDQFTADVKTIFV